MTGTSRRWRLGAAISTPSVPTGIYGTIICAATLAAAGDKPAAKVAVAVVVTLFVYWTAERYSEVLGLAPNPGDSTARSPSPITREHVRHVLRSGWPMIQASVTPLLVLLGSRLLGASSAMAVNIALGYTVALLVLLGALAGTRAGLTGWPRAAAAGFAALLGLAVVGLKVSLH